MYGRWDAVCRQGPCGPLRSFEPWVHWIPFDLHGFCWCVFDAFDALHEFVRQVVTSRRDTGLRIWARWMHEDLGSRPCHWLRADYVPPSRPRTKRQKTSRIMVEPHLIDAEFCTYVCRSGHPVVTVQQFLDFCWPVFYHIIDLPRITGQDLFDVAQA